MKNWTRRMREEGRCVQCGQPNPRAPRWFCPPCAVKACAGDRLAKNRAHGQRMRDERKSRGVCTRCGTEPTQRLAWCLHCRLESLAKRKVASA